MKKLIIRTAVITLCGFLFCGALILVILSFAAPRVMMDFTGRMGMESLAGNFAYSEYEKSGDVDCLARAFLVAAEEGEDKKASERWDMLYAEEKFDTYCTEKGENMEELPPDYSYRDILTGNAARVKYRLAKTDEEKAAALTFAMSETAESFPAGNPVIALAAEAISQGDTAFAGIIKTQLSAAAFDRNADYLRLVEALG